MNLCCTTLVLFAVSSAAQSLPDSVLSGRVTDSLTHQPITGARMWADPDARTTTDQDGMYTLRVPVERDPAGTMLWVDKTGYAASRPKEPVNLKSGTVTKHDVELVPAAAISGRLFDRDSDRPLSGFFARLIPGPAPTFSDADGRFTFADLAPGDYTLEVLPPPAKEREEVDYADTWYPGVDRPDMAAKIMLAPGSTRAIEVRLRKRELRTISGTVKAPEGFSAAITVVPLNLNRQSVNFNRTINSTKPFRLEGFAEGTYSLLLFAGESLFAHKTIDIRDQDIDDVVLTLQPPVTVRAAIVMAEQDEKRPSPANVYFNLWPLDGWDPMIDTKDRPDQIRANGIPPGRHWPFLLFAQPGYAVASVTYGNQDVTNQPIDVEAPDSTVTFTVTARLGSAAGRVLDSDSKPLRGTLILAISASLAEATPPEVFDVVIGRLPQVSATAASDGNYRLANLAPGKYKMITLTGADKNRRTDSAFIREALISAETVTVEASQTTNHDLKLPQ